MNGTLLKRNADDTIHLVGFGKGWILEDTASGEIIDKTTDYQVKDEWVKKYKLNRNVGGFWYRKDLEESDIMNSRKPVKSAYSTDDIDMSLFEDVPVADVKIGDEMAYYVNEHEFDFTPITKIDKDRYKGYTLIETDKFGCGGMYNDTDTVTIKKRNVHSSRKPVKSSAMKYGDFLNKLREEGYPEEAISNVIADNAYMISENDPYSETDQQDFRRRLKYELKELEERGLYKPVESRLDQSCKITSARRGEVDSIAADELALCTENDGDLYRQMTLPVIDNLKRKMAKGIYDEQLALKAWLNVVTAEARKYVREFGSPGDTIDRMFNLATREEAAKEVARYYEDHLNQ